MRILTNLEILHSFHFSSDHRVGRFTIKIPLRIRYINFRKKAESTVKLITSRYKVEEASELLLKELASLKENTERKVQELYDEVERAIITTMKKIRGKKEKGIY